MNRMWRKQHHFMHINNLTYTYRIKTKSIFQGNQVKYFDIFVLNDPNLEQHQMFNNIWRETILLSCFNDQRIQPIMQFGQLPDKIIYREIDEIEGITFADYIKNRLISWQHSPDHVAM